MIDEKKLIEELNRQKHILTFEDTNPIDEGFNCGIDKAIQLVESQSKVGEWISVEEREPSCSCTCLTWVKAKTTYSQYEKCVLANYYDGFFDVFPFDVFPYIDDEPNEVQILAWMPLPEYPRPYSSGD